MANNINFRGEINEMSASYFIREMESLPARSSATIYLHTPGGDIYSGGEMVNSLRAACKRGIKMTIEVGSLCASMGASLLAAARASGCKAVAHANSEVMFHGCWTILVGGADELTDQAKAMSDFNACVKRDLAAIGITDTEDWFSADRQKWLNAEELLSLGLIDSIVEDSANDVDLKSDAVKIAAKLNHQETPNMDEPTMTDAANAAEVVPTEPVQDVVETAPVASISDADIDARIADAVSAKADELANARFASLQSKHDKLISDLTKERDAALDDLAKAKANADAVATSLQADIEKLEHDLADARDQLAKAEQVRESIVVSALADDSEPRTYADVMSDRTASPEDRIAAALAEVKARKHNS